MYGCRRLRIAYEWGLGKREEQRTRGSLPVGSWETHGRAIAASSNNVEQHNTIVVYFIELESNFFSPES